MKPFRNFFLLLSIFAYISLTGCGSKDFHCDNAQLCIKNVGQDTIHYAWGSSWYDQKMGPGESACTFVGEVYRKSSLTTVAENYPVVPFDSDHGSFGIEVNACYVEKEID
jgi:hypothetical protein